MTGRESAGRKRKKKAMARYDNEGPKRQPPPAPEDPGRRDRRAQKESQSTSDSTSGHVPVYGKPGPRRERFPRYNPAEGKSVTRYRHQGYGHDKEGAPRRRKLTSGNGIGAVPRSPLPDGMLSVTLFQPEAVMDDLPGWTSPSRGLPFLRDALTGRGIPWWEDSGRDITAAGGLHLEEVRSLCEEHGIPSFAHIAVGEGMDSFHAVYAKRDDRGRRWKRVREYRIIGISPSEVLEKAGSVLGMKIPKIPDEILQYPGLSPV